MLRSNFITSARSHISLEVSDLDAAIRFYSLVFRMAPTKQRDDYANYKLESPALHLALEYRPDRASGNPFKNQHFGIELFEDEDLLSWRNWLQAVGVPYRVEEQVTCCYAVANKFWLTDPDGHEWEFWIRTDEADLMHGDIPDAPAVDCCVPSSAQGSTQSNIQDNEAVAPQSAQSSCCG
ncbi:MAG: glyoxalase/bleomycin resistance/dioxygenase family protein [Merismopedia sp. SIO2A8]|nr:glyoxalase/bleomycin resistance/dioxygenase family protein [Symploca sp. SIO2B6]NET49991.1 glyoxalase/bleomycin resistance/dioxygenase family protein [Merismopedia sp. SIO2A8]